MLFLKKIFPFLQPATNPEIFEFASKYKCFWLQKKVYRLVHKDERRGCATKKGKAFYGCKREQCPIDLQTTCDQAIQIMGKNIKNKKLAKIVWLRIAKTMPPTGEGVMRMTWSWLDNKK